MDYNYHTHTYRSRHATETPEEYILRAIEGGIKYLGFSDHIPFAYPDGCEQGHRIPMVQRYDYVKELSELRNKYSDKIDIKIGFEIECLPSYFDEMVEIARECGGEYLILGQHFAGDGHPKMVHALDGTDDVSIMKEYVSLVLRGIKSGVVTYVAHPDIFHFLGNESDYQREMSKICEASKKENVPIEINFLGIRTNRIYPNNMFWNIAGEIGCPVVFGSDAHDALNTFDEASLEKALEMVEQYKLNYIGKPEIKPI